jgi:hypothetical protein
MLRGLTLHCDPAVIAQAIWNGNALLASDGSVKHGNGTYGFALAINIRATTYTLAAVAHGRMPDLADHIEMDSHRPEGAALYAGLTWIQTLLLAHPRPPGLPPPTRSIRVVIDNKSVTQDSQNTMHDNTPVFAYLRPDYDITQGIQKLLASLPVPTHICWVKSHQDSDTPWDTLSNDARLNVTADKACEIAHTAEPLLTGIFPEHVPGTHASIHFQGRMISKHAHSRAQHHPIFLLDSSYTSRHEQRYLGGSQAMAVQVHDHPSLLAFCSRHPSPNRHSMGLRRPDLHRLGSIFSQPLDHLLATPLGDVLQRT